MCIYSTLIKNVSKKERREVCQFVMIDTAILHIEMILMLASRHKNYLGILTIFYKKGVRPQ